MHRERSFALNAAGIGRLNTGLVQFGIMLFTLHVFAETYQHLKEEVSMISHQKSIKFSIEHS